MSAVTIAGLAACTLTSVAPTAMAGGGSLSARSACTPVTTTSGAYTTVKFTAATSCDWVVPVGVTAIDVLAVGGGGSGGSGQSATSISSSGGGGGGGGGGQRRILTGQAVTAGAVYSVSVGAGGSNGAGGSSAVGALVTATGGSSGGSPNFYSGGVGGSGGSGGTGATGSAGGDGKINNSSGPYWGGDNVDVTFAGSTYCTSAGGGGGYLVDRAGGQAPGGACTSARVGGTGAGYSNANGIVNPTSGASNTGAGGGGGGYTVGSSYAGAAGGSGIIVIAYSQGGLTPILGAVTPVGTGFTVPIANYDASYSWAASATVGSASVAGSTVTVTGLPANTSSTVTVTSSRAGYANASASVTGQQERVAQTVTWSPTTVITTTASPLTPSAVPTANGGGAISYSKVSSTTGSCSVDSSTGVLTYSGAGTCTVRATAASTASYLAGSTDVTFTVSRAAQSVTWSPTGAVTTVQSPLTPSTPASALGGASISYSKVSNTTTSCSVDSSSGVLTYSGTGTCTVRATAAETVSYDSGFTDVTFTVSAAPQAVSWSPTSTLSLASISVDLGPASTSGDGAISYSVTSPGGTGCAFADATRPVLTYASSGSCSVTATAASTAGYAQATSSTAIAISRATPTVSWSPVTALAMPAATVTPVAATTTSDGSMTYAVTSDTGAGCSVNAGTGSLTYAATGQCQVTATSVMTTRYSAGSTAATFTVSPPPPPSTGGGSGGGGSGGPSDPGNPSRPNSSTAGAEVSNGPTESTDQAKVPGTATSTRGRALPPRPRDVQVTPIPGGSRSTVRIRQPDGVAGSQVLATVVVVRDSRGAVVSRIRIALEPGQSQATVTVPFVATGYSVNVYNVNEVGVSDGALRQSPLVRATTITARTSSGQPTLFGTLLGRPIYFNGGSAVLDAGDRARLRAIAQVARVANERVFVTGFARRGAGPVSELATLSTRRARAAATYLVEQGVRVWTRYWGAGALNGSGAAADRRVEVRTSALPIPRSLVP